MVIVGAVYGKYFNVIAYQRHSYIVEALMCLETKNKINTNHLAQVYLYIYIYTITDMERQKKKKKTNSVKRKTALASRQKQIGIQLSSGHRAERISNGMRFIYFFYFLSNLVPRFLFVYILF